MADKGKNHETDSATIPSAYTMYEAEDGSKYLIPQFMANSTKFIADAMERKKKLDLRATTSKVSLLFTPSGFGFQCRFEAACTRRPC
jgi:hypothetical protein